MEIFEDFFERIEENTVLKIKVNYQCDKCGKGLLAYNNKVVAGELVDDNNPLKPKGNKIRVNTEAKKYIHTCNNPDCLDIVVLDKIYPFSYE
jgi:hypothetical protein